MSVWKIVREVKVASEPEAIVSSLADRDFTIARIGLEAGPLSHAFCSIIISLYAWVTQWNTA
jgi:hypothetical protein